MKIRGSLFVVLACVLFPLTLVFTYPISVYSEHVYPFWPYISYTGDGPVESCIFSLGLNCVAGLYFLIVYLRYMQIHNYLETEPNKHQSLVNKSSIFWGVLGSLSLSMTSTFPERIMGVLHPLSAVTCSFAGLLYFWHQTYFSVKYVEKWMTKGVTILRIVLISVSTMLHVFLPCLYLYLLLNCPKTHNERKRMSPDEEDYGPNVIGAIVEWIVFLMNEIFIGSFYGEFRDIHIALGQIIFKQTQNV